MPSLPLHVSPRSRAFAVGALILVSGCLTGFPQRTPGSDMTLPPPTRFSFLESLLECATNVQGIAGPENAGMCRSVTGDSVPDPRVIIRPPTRVP